jgi:hypothetical protein
LAWKLHWIIVSSPYKNGTNDGTLESHAKNYGNTCSLAYKMDANQAQIVNREEWTIAKMDVWLEEMKTWQKLMMACQEAMKACLESKEPTPLERESESEHQEVPKKDTTIKTVKALKKQYGGGDLSVGHD